MYNPNGPSNNEIDLQVLEDLACAVGDEGIHELIDSFLASLRQQQSAVDDGFARADWKCVGDNVHSMKSAAAYLGATDFSSLCERIETSVRNGDIDTARRHRAEINKRAVRVAEELALIRTTR